LRCSSATPIARTSRTSPPASSANCPRPRPS
jgi:hypothetical protein